MAINIGLEYKLNTNTGKSVNEVFGSFGSLINVILPNIYVLASLILFFLLIGGGIMVIANAGNDNPQGVANGKKAITAAVIGFIIIFASYWILQIIEKITGINILNTNL